MSADLEELGFLGAVRRVVEERYGALLPDEGGADQFLQTIRQQYLHGGSPRGQRAWIVRAISPYFQWVEEPPRWVERLKPRWPFCDGRPMVFLRQFEVADTPITREAASAGAVLYVFGGRVRNAHGWSMAYEVVEQHRGL